MYADYVCRICILYNACFNDWLLLNNKNNRNKEDSLVMIVIYNIERQTNV